MAVIKPFRGFLYNQEKVKNLELVVAPPYDVITPEQQNHYYKKHSFNVIRLILGKEEPSDNERNNKYTRAANYLSNWKDNKILIKNHKPSIYFYIQDFTLPDGEPRKRKGFISLVKIEEFSSGIILPHERTMSTPKKDRLNLILACEANFNPIFSLFSDPKFQIENRIDDITKKAPPFFDIIDEKAVRHQLWIIDNPETIDYVKMVMLDKKLLIADGHHRYETAINYRNLMREKYPDYKGNEAFNYTMMYFTNMNDPGLVILPTHRLVKKINFNLNEFIRKAKEFFEIESIPTNPELDYQVRKKILSTMKNESTKHYLFAMFSKIQDSYFIFRLKDFNLLDKVMEKSFFPALRKLDANIMEVLVFQTILGINCNNPEHEEKIKFVHTDDEAINMVRSGEYEVAFLVNPTRIEQVKEIVAQGEKMPQKSTYFFPKLLSGLVINQIVPDEKIE